MPDIKKSPFKLDKFLIKEFSIKREAVKKGKIDFKISPSGFFNGVEKTFILNLDINLKDSNDSFIISMTALGFFSFKDVISLESISSYFYTNASAIVFPYIRSYISAITALSGLETINLPVMNLSSLRKELQENTTNSNALN